MRGILQDLSFCGWLISCNVMSSRFIHKVAGNHISPLFKLNKNTPSCGWTTFCVSARGHLVCFHFLAPGNHSAVKTGMSLLCFLSGSFSEGQTWDQEVILWLAF